MKPVLLLDVDGVVNALSRRGWPDDTIWADLRIGRYRIQIAHPVVDWLQRLHDEGRVEVQWHTTWQDLVYQITNQLGLPKAPITDAPEITTFTDGSDGWWKIPAVTRALESERPVIWVDDDIDYDVMARAVVDSTATHVPRLLVCPGSMEGLMADQIARIDGWIDSYEKIYGEVTG